MYAHAVAHDRDMGLRQFLQCCLLNGGDRAGVIQSAGWKDIPKAQRQRLHTTKSHGAGCPFVHDSAELWLALNMRHLLRAPKAKRAATPGRCGWAGRGSGSGGGRWRRWPHGNTTTRAVPCHPSFCHRRRVYPARSCPRTHRRGPCRYESFDFRVERAEWWRSGWCLT
jgi:hypothetical protein